MRRRSSCCRADRAWAGPIGIVLAGAFAAVSAAADARLVGDINTHAGSSQPTTYAIVGERLFFTALDVDHGRELWVTDGTPEGTALFKDINPGQAWSHAGWLSAAGARRFFTANDGVHGSELWITDGTAEGTRLVKDIVPGTAGVEIAASAVMNGRLCFAVDDLVHGLEIWVSDGTAEGTALLKDINPGAAGSNLGGFTLFDGRLFMWASDGTHGLELWVSDGTPDGTMLFAEVAPGAAGRIAGWLCALDDKLLFAADDGVHGNELWVCDGTPAGTVLLKDIAPGSVPTDTRASSFPTWLTRVGDRVYFAATDLCGTELWVSDGTAAGTMLLKDIQPGSRGSEPQALAVMGDRLIFSARDIEHGREPWVSDGTPEGTVLFKDLTEDPAAYFQWALTVGPRTFLLVLRSTDAEPLGELWVTDGDPEHTLPFHEAVGREAEWHPGWPVFLADRFVVAAVDSEHGRELWLSDGTATGTRFLKDINTGTADALPAWLSTAGGKLFFWADDGEHGLEPWVSDGTSEGTVFIMDIRPGGGESRNEGWGDMGTQLPTALDGRLFFWADDGEHGCELWVSDGTAAGTSLFRDINPGPDSSFSSPCAVIADRLFFLQRSRACEPGLCISDGTAEHTLLVRRFLGVASFPDQVSMPVALGERIFFLGLSSAVSNSNGLWSSDGTPGGTALLVPPGLAAPVDPSRSNLTVAGDRLFFAAWHAELGQELWISDGTTEGTALLKDINPGPEGSYPDTITAVGPRVFFTADDGAHGRELWVSDGTPAGTCMVVDIVPGDPERLMFDFGSMTAAGELLFFAAADFREARFIYSWQLWVSDGSAEGTRKIRDLGHIPGLGASGPVYHQGVLYFPSFDGAHGAELWAMPWEGIEEPPPALTAPAGLRVLEATRARVRLGWRDSAEGTAPYAVERRGYVERGFSVLAALPAGSEEFIDTAPLAGSAWYRVRMTGPGGPEGFAFPVRADAGTPFRRGDTNADEKTDIGDAIFVLAFLFAAGPAPSCGDAADANDSGRIDIADAIALLAHFFAAAGPLPAPFEWCGVDPSEDGVSCESFAPCGP